MINLDSFHDRRFVTAVALDSNGNILNSTAVIDMETATQHLETSGITGFNRELEPEIGDETAEIEPTELSEEEDEPQDDSTAEAEAEDDGEFPDHEKSEYNNPSTEDVDDAEADEVQADEAQADDEHPADEDPAKTQAFEFNDDVILVSFSVFVIFSVVSYIVSRKYLIKRSGYTKLDTEGTDDSV